MVWRISRVDCEFTHDIRQTLTLFVLSAVSGCAVGRRIAVTAKPLDGNRLNGVSLDTFNRAEGISV